MKTNVVDEMLADFRPSAHNEDISAGLRRGQDYLALSAKADTGLLEELFGEGEHRNAASQVANRSGLVAATGNWRNSPAAHRAQAAAYDSLPHTQDDLQNGQFKDASDEGSILGDVVKQASTDDPQNLADIGKPYIDAAQVKKWIGDQLTLGQTPNQVFAGLKRLAAQAVFDQTPMYDYLKDQSGLNGMAFIEPNQFNKECKASLAHIRAHGQLRAASVKRIAACANCTECKCDPSGNARCATYGRPIVSNPAELGKVVASLTGGSMKKASLVDRHNGTPTVTSNVLPTRTAAVAPATPRVGQVTHFNADEFRTANSKFSTASVLASLNEGTPFERIFASAKLEHGTQTAERVCRAFLDGIKGTGQRINLASVDCSLLKRRLASSETIIGASKCAGCTLRNGMHCALTGGTLLSYPGMDKVGMNSKRAALAATQTTDGMQLMASLELIDVPEMVIPIRGDRTLMQVDETK